MWKAAILNRLQYGSWTHLIQYNWDTFISPVQDKTWLNMLWSHSSHIGFSVGFSVTGPISQCHSVPARMPVCLQLELNLALQFICALSSIDSPTQCVIRILLFQKRDKERSIMRMAILPAFSVWRYFILPMSHCEFFFFFCRVFVE